ncbi:hypothetical protein HWV23_01420 [Natronomonas halophila]|uniref:hypothetical protein n=1 Tax=Natronomonas halophila TaxID=2747817 RepID=UPI0015B6F2EE|nr:hypothetical protein [Natronomonas halophila]QLD84420.1 hypothetical protein HWV23_01420 [Natronomonas halophila]
MPSSPPFVDPATGELDIAQIISEAVPLGRLIGLFAVIGFIPFSIGAFGYGNSTVGVVFVLLAQFVLAVGAGVVLIYVIVRGTQLAEE